METIVEGLDRKMTAIHSLQRNAMVTSHYVMKTILKLFLIVALLASMSGCMSHRVIQTARGDPNTQLGDLRPIVA